MYRPLEASEELLDTQIQRLGWILKEDTLEGGEKVEVNLRAHLGVLRLIPHDQFCQLLKVWSFFCTNARTQEGFASDHRGPLC